MTEAAPGILNDVLGPVFRGPSSSHTAGSYHIAVLARALLGATPDRACVTFDAAGSYAQVYRQQGVDRAFVAGLLGWTLIDERFFEALDLAPAEGMAIAFRVGRIEGADHPNTVDIELDGGGRHVRLRAKSVGGGAVEIVLLDGWPVRLDGQTCCAVAELDAAAGERARVILGEDGRTAGEARWQVRGDAGLLVVPRAAPVPAGTTDRLRAGGGLRRFADLPALAFVKRGRALFSSAAEMVALSEERAWSLGRVAIEYEAGLLGMPREAPVAEMIRRFDIMRAAVREGLSASARPMQLLTPTARKVMEAEAEGHVAIGGLHTRAAARAMAAMHVNGAMGVVCAAPTGGSAGVLPGVVVTLAEERGLDEDGVARSLFAAGAIGLVVARRATFAAEVAGCQVEIGAAGAMAAAAVVEAAGGSPRQAADAAAIAFQNTMGSVCDLVQGMVEIPCHTRNAAAAASAFVCADLAMGGYENPIPLDETIDAVYDVGRMLPPELRCTARGGIALAPSALRLRR